MPLVAHITLARSGRRFTVNSDETILEAALRQEIWLPHACRGGICGSCRAVVVAGAFAGAAARGMQQTHALLCCTRTLSDLVLDIAELPARPVAATYRRPARVISIVKPSRDVAVVTLKPPPAAAISFRPGQYICLIGDDGRRHPFSIANAPRHDGTLELHVGRIPNGRFTTHVHVRLQAGDVVRFEGPFGEFGFSSRSECPGILLAGGTGIAPIKAMLEEAAQAPQRELHLYWGSRSSEGLYAIKQISGSARVTGVVSEPTKAWRGRCGLVHRAVLDDFPDMSRFEVYACGSPGLIDTALESFTRRAGLSPNLFFAEAFHHAGTVPHVASAAG
jgi:NAD(P)H-flavin reductase/ferredoxin